MENTVQDLVNEFHDKGKQNDYLEWITDEWPVWQKDGRYIVGIDSYRTDVTSFSSSMVVYHNSAKVYDFAPQDKNYWQQAINTYESKIQS